MKEGVKRKGRTRRLQIAARSAPHHLTPVGKMAVTSVVIADTYGRWLLQGLNQAGGSAAAEGILHLADKIFRKGTHGISRQYRQCRRNRNQRRLRVP